MNCTKKKSKKKRINVLQMTVEVVTENPILDKSGKPHQMKFRIFKQFH